METRNNKKSATSISFRAIHQAIMNHELLEKAALSLDVTTASLTSMLKRRGIIPTQLRKIKIEDAAATLATNYDLPITKESVHELSKAGFLKIEKKNRVFFNPPLSKIHKKILDSKTIEQTAKKLHTKKGTLVSSLTRAETSWSELRAISRKKMKKILLDKYNQPICLESIQLIHEKLFLKNPPLKRKSPPKSKEPQKKKRKTKNKIQLGNFSFKEIHAAILNSESTKQAAQLLGVNDKALSNYLIRLKITYTELKNLLVEDAEAVLQDMYQEKITLKSSKLLRKNVHLKNHNNPTSEHRFPAQVSFSEIHNAIYTHETIEKAAESIQINANGLIKFLSRRGINFSILKKIPPEFAQENLQNDYYQPILKDAVKCLIDAFFSPKDEQQTIVLDPVPTPQDIQSISKDEDEAHDDTTISSYLEASEKLCRDTSPNSSPGLVIDEEWENNDYISDHLISAKDFSDYTTASRISVTTFAGLNRFGFYASVANIRPRPANLSNSEMDNDFNPFKSK